MPESHPTVVGLQLVGCLDDDPGQSQLRGVGHVRRIGDVHDDSALLQEHLVGDDGVALVGRRLLDGFVAQPLVPNANSRQVAVGISGADRVDLLVPKRVLLQRPLDGDVVDVVGVREVVALRRRLHATQTVRLACRVDRLADDLADEFGGERLAHRLVGKWGGRRVRRRSSRLARVRRSRLVLTTSTCAEEESQGGRGEPAGNLLCHDGHDGPIYSERLSCSSSVL